MVNNPAHKFEGTPGGSNGGRPTRHLIVGIGASAGGLQAFKTFFANMPSDSGMSFVLVQHLDPEHRSMLVELLSSATAMPVIEAADNVLPAADNVYVIPPNATLRIAQGKLRVSKPAPAREHRRPVDTFFLSLATDQEENAVCIILSGGGSDGTEGLREIKEQGGLTIAQAAFDEHAMIGMPFSAAATGLVDFVLPIEEMPAKLVAYSKHLLTVQQLKDSDGIRQDAGEHLARICSLPRSKLGHDFGQYKEKTLIRRIQRRMQILQTDTMSDYVERLRKESGECELLFHELLIGVTHFFRDAPLSMRWKSKSFRISFAARAPTKSSGSGFRLARPEKKCTRLRFCLRRPPAAWTPDRDSRSSRPISTNAPSRSRELGGIANRSSRTCRRRAANGGSSRMAAIGARSRRSGNCASFRSTASSRIPRSRSST
jgi:hypothetical protein